MAFLDNPFDLLNDRDGNDDAELSIPIAVGAEKNSGKKKNNSQQTQRSSVAPDKSRMTRPHPGRFENATAGMGRGSANGNGFHRLDNWQDDARDNGQTNGRKYNGQDDVNKQYGGNGYGYRQNRRGNGYPKENRQSNSFEQNNDGGYSHYGRGSDSAGYEVNAGNQLERRGRGDSRGMFNKINGSRNEVQVLEVNQEVKSQGQEKLAEGDSFGDVPQPENGNGGWNVVGDRKASGGKGGFRGNGSWRNQFSSMFGGTNRRRGETFVHKPKESLNGESRDNDDKSVTNEGEERTEVSKLEEPRQRNQSEEVVIEDKKVRESNMTLEEYEKQLTEKRKALEALKPQERKVTLDKDFESMQLVGRNKEDFATKLNSEKENREEEESIEKVQLKKEEQPELERVKRSMSMDVFLKVFKRSDRRGEGRLGYRRDFHRDGRGNRGEHNEERRHYSGGYSRNEWEDAPNAGKTISSPSKDGEIDIQNSEHFPGLNAIAKA